MEIVTPLGDDVLLFHRMHAQEELSRLSEFELDLLSAQGDIDIDKILGKNVTVNLEVMGGAVRHFNGYVTRFAQVGTHGRYHAYRAMVRPWLWFLTRTADCRIFQDMTVPEIIKKVFDDHSVADLKDSLTESYRKWDYCVQYRETDFNFVSRLMEQEGIYYYFKHEEGRHTLVLVDACSSHEPVDGYASLPFIPSERVVRPEQEYIRKWDYAREIHPGNYELEDYDFERPSVDLAVKSRVRREHVLADYEIFDYPGEYVQSADGEKYVQARIDELQTRFEMARGDTNARGLSVGHLFKLTGQPRSDQNREYLVLAATHTLSYDEYESMNTGGTGASYSCAFSALWSRQQFRPERATPKPIVQGPQTAVVVGPGGDEIYTDKYGRVKVQFHWDRYGTQDENSSCWIRPSHPWAGKNWGMVAIPRIGQEVIVDFLEGDPDQPIITGRVYNAEQMPPYALPANMTQTGILSRSSKGGSGANANELRFEDKTGSEQVYLHAEKNQDIEVENDETHWVGHDRSKTIDHDETTHVKHDRTETVDNNETITIGVDRQERVNNNETISIGANRSETVGNNETIRIGANRKEHVGANETIDIADNREITVSGAEKATVKKQREHNVQLNETIKVGLVQSVQVGADQTVKVGANQSVSVSGDMKESIGGAQTYAVSKARTTTVGEDDKLSVKKNLVIDAGESVTIKTGNASITMKKDGTVIIKGKDITIDASGKVNVKAGGDIVMKGSKILQN
ncbi:type VI secretion system Vgr family protein [Pseudoduganella sp. OTU4001]|uniref:type VI secretion system Vgr family protein n=1 Tax=Pseudoduganella sp. OTU4001 TaxID=3043854 RepID=UPI00313E22D5